MANKQKFSSIAWELNLPLYKKTLKMSFNEELKQGRLDKAKFRQYIIQDTKYLEAYGRAFALAASKAKNSDQFGYLIGIAKEIIEGENSMHNEYFKKFEVSKEEYESTEMSPACHHYTSFLIAIGHQESLPVILASLLPCFWIYGEVGKAIKANSSKNNPFQLWIDQYGSEEFDKSVQKMIDLVDELALNESEKVRKRMHEVYKYSARLEFNFWESAYQLEKWV